MLKDLLTSLLLFGAAVAYFVLATRINQSALADDFGAAGLPRIYACLLGAIALALAGKSMVSQRLLRGPGANATDGVAARDLVRAGGMLAVGVAYVLAVPYLGYPVTLVFVIAFVAWYQHERPGLRLALVSVGGGLIFYAFFVLLLGIEMPAGAWPALMGL